MDTFAPFSLRYHNRDGGTSAAPIREVPIGEGGDTISEGDPVQVEAGVAADYIAGDDVFGVAVYDFPAYAAAGKDQPYRNLPLIHPTKDEGIVYRVQAKLIESAEDVVCSQALLGNTYNLAGNTGVMYLDVSSAESDFLVIGIEHTVSEWTDLYPILLVKVVNYQDVDPSIAT